MIANDKIIEKLETISILEVSTAKCMCSLEFNVPNKRPVAFHNGSSYDSYFIIKELTNEFKGQFDCLGENTEKYKNLSVPIEKEVTEIDIDNKEKVAAIFYKIRFVDSKRSMASSLSNLVNSLAEKFKK